MPDATGQAGQRVTIVAHRPGSPELPWVRCLLGDMAGDVVEDEDRQVVLPYSLMVCDRPDLLKGKVLAAVRRLGTVGLFHVSDRRYRTRLDAYGSFGFVWRTYYHSGLAESDVRQLPVGPVALPEVTPSPRPAALRPPADRLSTWSFAGQLNHDRLAMLEAFRQIEGGQEQISGERDWSRLAEADATAIMEALGDSVFVPCPADDGHLESPRVYEALEAGAIPVVERRRRFDYFHQLLGDHPLPTVRSWADAPRLVSALLADERGLAALQQQVVEWWTATKEALAAAAQSDARQCFDDMLAGVERDGTPLSRPAPRWRSRVEMLRHRGIRLRT